MSEQPKQLVRKFFEEGLNKRNLDLLNEFLDDSYVNHGFPGTLPGPEGIKGVLQQFFNAFPDMNITIEEVIAEGDTAASRGYMKGTHKGDFMGIPATGKEIHMNYIDLWKFRNGKAIENWAQLDMIGLMHQLGVMQS